MPSHEALESTGSMRGLLLFYTVNPPAFSSLFLRFFFAFSSLFLGFFFAFSWLPLRVKDSQLAAFAKYMR